MATIELGRDEIEPIIRHVLEVADRFEPDRISYTQTEAARQLGISVDLLASLRDTGKIPARRLGPKLVMYLREDLINFMTQQEMAS